MTNNNNNNSTMSLRSVLEKDKLTGTNFLDWFRNLRIVLKQERKLYVLEWRMLETVGQFGLQYSVQTQGTLGSLAATPSLLSRVIESQW